ncbi:hypothetical protein ACEUAP_11185 [Aeromonas veronii]
MKPQLAMAMPDHNYMIFNKNKINSKMLYAQKDPFRPPFGEFDHPPTGRWRAGWRVVLPVTMLTARGSF